LKLTGRQRRNGTHGTRDRDHDDAPAPRTQRAPSHGAGVVSFAAGARANTKVPSNASDRWRVVDSAHEAVVARDGRFLGGDADNGGRSLRQDLEAGVLLLSFDLRQKVPLAAL
jgi:hypothetical protein